MTQSNYLNLFEIHKKLKIKKQIKKINQQQNKQKNHSKIPTFYQLLQGMRFFASYLSQREEKGLKIEHLESDMLSLIDFLELQDSKLNKLKADIRSKIKREKDSRVAEIYEEISNQLSEINSLTDNHNN